MTENSAQPSVPAQRVDQAAMRRRSATFRIVNGPMRAVLALPFPTPLSRNLMLVRDPAEVERLLDVIVAGDPPAATFIPLPRTADGRLEPTALAAAIDHGFAIVRWHLN